MPSEIQTPRARLEQAHSALSTLQNDNNESIPVSDALVNVKAALAILRNPERSGARDEANSEQADELSADKARTEFPAYYEYVQTALVHVNSLCAERQSVTVEGGVNPTEAARRALSAL